MSINCIIKNLRINKGVSQAEVAYKLNLNIIEVSRFEEEGVPISGDLFLRLLAIYDSSLDELMRME